MNDSRVIQGLVEQLNVLYKEKQVLHEALGVSDPQSVLMMVRSLEEQLCSLYDEKRSIKIVQMNQND